MYICASEHCAIGKVVLGAFQDFAAYRLSLTAGKVAVILIWLESLRICNDLIW